jgi:uncharacterized protein YmfQ (DUF2313 family)
LRRVKGRLKRERRLGREGVGVFDRESSAEVDADAAAAAEVLAREGEDVDIDRRPLPRGEADGMWERAGRLGECGGGGKRKMERKKSNRNKG